MTDPFAAGLHQRPTAAFPPPPGAAGAGGAGVGAGAFNLAASSLPPPPSQHGHQQPSTAPPPPPTDFASSSSSSAAPPPPPSEPPLIAADDDGDGEPEWVGNVEFFPRTPMYNDRVIPLCVLALLPLIPAFGSFPVAVVAVVGTGATYIADMMNFRRTTIALLLCTMCCIWVGFYLGNVVEVWNSVAAFVVLLNASFLMCLVAVWALIHVRWFVLRFPEISVRMERIVVGLLPMTALPSLVSTCAALAGSRHAVFLLAPIMCCLHWAFYWRRPSSFAVLTAPPGSAASSGLAGAAAGAGAASSSDEQQHRELRDVCFVVQKPESVVFSLLVLLLPAVLHMCFIWPTVSRTMLAASAVTYGRYLLLVNAAGLVAIPSGYFLFFHVRALWFLRQRPGSLAARFYFNVIDKHRLKLGVAAYMLGCVFAVSRLMKSRYSFYFSGFVPPLNSIMLLLIGAALPVLVVLSKELYKTVDAKTETPNNTKSLWGGCLALSLIITIATCLTLGMPGFFVMTTTLSVAALWAYLVDRKRNAGQYTLFMFMSSIALLWWMFQSFSFVISDLKVFGAEGIVPAPLVAGSMLWVYVFGCWLVPLSFQKEAKFLFTIVLVFHSQKVLWIERVLYTQSEQNTYPVQFLLITSIVGALTMWRLFKNEVLSAGPASVVIGAYVSKIVVYFSDSVEIDYRWSDGTSFEAIMRETLMAYSCWAAMSFAIYAYLKVLPEAAVLRQFRASQKQMLARSQQQKQQQEQEEQQAAGEGASSSSSSSPPPSPTAQPEIQVPNSLETGKPLTSKEIVDMQRRFTITAVMLSLSVFVFFVFAAPTLVRWFVEDILRVPSPSRLQLIGAAFIFSTLCSWYQASVFFDAGSSVSSELGVGGGTAAGAASFHKIFAGLALVLFAATMLDPPVEAALDLIAAGEANTPYQENESGFSDRPRQHLLLPDLPFQAPWWSRWVLLFALAAGVGIRGLLSLRLPPFPVRAILWTTLGVLLGLSVTGTSIIIADWKIYLVMSAYFVLMLLCFDQGHYNKLENTEIGITLFISALVTFVIGVFLLNHVDIFAVTKHETYLLDGVFASRAGAIGILAACSFTLAATLKCRISGLSLMPHPARIESLDAISQLSLILTSSCALGAVALILLALLLGAGSAPLILLAGGMLLLVDDRGWGFGLERGLRRYFVPFVVVSVCLWVRGVQEILHTHTMGPSANRLPYYVASLLCVPSQIVVSYVLWRGGSADPATAKAAAGTARGVVALVMLLVDLVVVVMTVSMNLRLLAALNLIGHVTRLSLLEGIIVRAKETFL